MNFPLRHISIRVPWHDIGWNGSICKSPAHNTACLKLVNIGRKKNEQAEELLKSRFIRDLDQKDFPPCVSERATFMADFDFERFHKHPYVKTAPDTHSHFKPASLRYAPRFQPSSAGAAWASRRRDESCRSYGAWLDVIAIADYKHGAPNGAFTPRPFFSAVR